MNMIERVAYALAVANERKASDKELAKIAIATMRDPNEEMLEPVTDADGYFKLSDPKQAYQAMIDAALKE